MAALLYYPLVEPPEEVLHQALLYWDGIASVVPRHRGVYEVAVPPELEALRERALYTPVRLSGEDGQLNGPAADVLRQELRQLAQDPPVSPRSAVFYNSMLSTLLESELLDLGLAERHRDGQWSIHVPPEVQQLVFSVLARELAAGPVPYVPYTDRPGAYEASLRAPGLARLPAFQADLGSLLPVPAPGTPTSVVLDFRDRHTDERVRLMRVLHRLLRELRESYEHPADVVAGLRHEIDQAAADHRAAGKGRGIAWVQRSVLVTAAVAAGAAGVAWPGAGWALGVAGGLTLNLATREIRPVGHARVDDDFSYLHSVRRKFG
ncbi:MAG TPA: hypothetical protein VIU15_47130 [Streptomyces sp.]